jgi:hypothetical protein
MMTTNGRHWQRQTVTGNERMEEDITNKCSPKARNLMKQISRQN